MKLSHHQLFIDSLIHPQKLAAYRILSIGKVIQYVFLMITVLTAFSFGRFTKNGTDSIFNDVTIAQYATDLTWLVYPLAIIFLFVMNSAIVFGKISLYAYAARWLLKLMNRRGEYRQIWRTAAFAITWASLLTIALSFYSFPNIIPTLLDIFISMLVIIIAIRKYPLLKRST